MTGHSNEARGVSILTVLFFVFSYWRRQPVRLSALMTLLALATVADSLLPYASGRLIDVLAEGPERPEAKSQASNALILFFVLATSFYAMRNTAIRLWVVFAARSMSQLVEESFAKVQLFSSDWHANNFAGATVRKVSRGMWAYDTISDVVMVGLGPPLLVIVAVTIQMALRWPVAGGFMLAATTVFVATSLAVSIRYVAPANQVSNDVDSKMGAALADVVTCNEVVKSFGAEASEVSRFHGIAQDWKQKGERAWSRYIDMWLIQSFVLLLMQGSLIGYSVWLWSRNEATAGDVTFVITGFFVVSSYLRMLGDNFQQLQRGVNELEDVVEFAQQRPGVKDHVNASQFQSGDGDIVFDRVSFGYANQLEHLYEDFSLNITPGERIALVGPSGSGKSTFIKLVQRLYDVDAGRILIDDQDIAHVTQASLRQTISLVPQDPVLFHRSLEENIAYGRPGASQSEIVEASKRAHAHEFVGKLPQGYKTLVGERGVKLSGGERQRVAIARAFLADARILILDEATSSLDSITEAHI